MLSTVKTVGIVGKHHEEKHIQAVCLLVRYCQDRQLNVFVEETTAEAVGLPELAASYEMLAKTIDLMIVAGGDGLMLFASRYMAPAGVPVLGINRGRLGFLTAFESKTMTAELDDVFSGKSVRKTRALIEGELFRHEDTPLETGNALNDIFICRGASGRLMEFELFVDDEFVYRQRADGLIVSTPTGSTAYALSANGPIVHPAVKGLLLVPLCPHSLSCRPLLVPDTAVIKCRLIDAPDAYLHFDGQHHVSINAGDVIVIQQAKDQVELILPEQYQYFDILRKKLHWSETPRFDDHE